MKLSKLSFIMLAAGMGVISSNAQDRDRSSSREDARKAWAERMQKYQSERAKATQSRDSRGRSSQSTRGNSSQSDDARKAWAERMKKYQEARAKAAQGRSSQGRDNSRSSQSRQPSSRERGGSRGQTNPLDPEAVKRRLDYGVSEGLLTREQADKLMAEAKKRMEVAGRENNERRERGDNNEGHDRESQSNDRQDQARMGYEVRRKRIEEGVRSGKIKREDAAKMLEELRKRMGAAKRGGNEKQEEKRQDPRLEKYRATERELTAAVKAGKLSKEDAQKKLIAVRKQLWGGDKSNKSSGNSRKRTGDIVDVAAGNKSFTTLVAAVKAAGLVDTLKGKGPYTVFAPTDAAFAKLPKGTLQSLLKPENKKKLVSILTYHVVPGRVLAKDVKSGRVKTANGSPLEIKLSRGDVTVNNAKVVATDVMASNGVIHVIDTVIIPQSIPPSRSSQRTSSQSRSSSRGYLGVSVESSSRPKGLRIQQVYANTAAARGKLKRGDIILKINGSAVTSNSSLISRLSKTKPNQKATLLISSGGNTKTLQVQLGGSYSTRSSAHSSSSKSGSSQSKSSSQPHTPQRSERNSRGRDNDRERNERGDDMRKAWEERMKDAREDRERSERDSRGRDNDRERNDRGDDMRKAWEKRMKDAREDRERSERNSRDRDNDHGRNDRGEAMREAVGEWIERAREMRERSERNSRGRDNDRGHNDRGDDMRKAVGEWIERAREMRERSERNSRGRDNDHGRNDRGDDMRKAWEERMKQKK